MKGLLITISALLLLPNFLWLNPQPVASYNGKEAYDPALERLNSVSKLIKFTDSIATEKKIQTKSLDYALLVTMTLRKRFYHGFSHYSLNQNWIAALTQYCFGRDAAAIVDPDKIMKYPYGGCSQQSIVFMEVMRRKGFDYRNLSFPHHYASELKIGNDWYFFDPNMEPNIPDSERRESAWKGSCDSLKKYYNKDIYKELDFTFGKAQRVIHGKVNGQLAPNARLFQVWTGFASKVLWVFPLIILYARKRRKTDLVFPSA